MSTDYKEDEATISKLEETYSDIKSILQATDEMDASLEKMDINFDAIQENLTLASRRMAPLQTLSIANKALDARINRAIAPALALLDSFKQSESLQRKLLDLSSRLSNENASEKRLKKLFKYVECVEELNAAINTVCQECEPAIQKLQEVVEFLSRTKATDQYRIYRLKETMVTLKALYETEVEVMKFDGLLDEALMNLQDEFEALLQQLKHQKFGELQGDDSLEMPVATELGTELEVEVLQRISEELAANDCLDICIDIYVKVRYKRAAKALMRLNPDYLKTYTPEGIDEMEWESLETAMTLWIQHFELAIQTVFVSEKNLCRQVLGRILDGAVWTECFVKITDKIMAVFFRFGEAVARSKKEPQKLFKLLEMYNSLETLKPFFIEVFDDEASADICLRYRELIKLLVHVSAKVFWEFGLQIEGNQDGVPPPQDGSVSKLVRYAVNYLKHIASDAYNIPMAKVLRTEQIWKSGMFSKPETDDDLLRDAICNVMEAIQRNLESKKLHCKDKVLMHIFSMNSYWYIYIRVRNSQLGNLLGEQYVKKKYKSVAEEAAYMYQKQAWGSLVRLLDLEELKRAGKNESGTIARGKFEAFMKGLNEMLQKHRSLYKIDDSVLREQIRDATVKLIVPAYSEFLKTNKTVLQSKSCMPPESIEEEICQSFDGILAGSGRSTHNRIGSRDHFANGGKSSSIEQSLESNDFQRFKSNASDK
ncbi:membrane traffic protein [Lithospermum erythrorhizon]|uniref:Exocyst subunit Exo70 family protein n=1 Tax=Lithospermum erythrorhizon TaxID=34254 RepID=A0AAV3NRM3_LITER